MKIITTARHIKITEAMKSSVKKNLTSIEHLFSNPQEVSINAILDSEGHHGEYTCHLTLNSEQIHSLNIIQKNHNIYKAISVASNRLKENIYKKLKMIKKPLNESSSK